MTFDPKPTCCAGMVTSRTTTDINKRKRFCNLSCSHGCHDSLDGKLGLGKPQATEDLTEYRWPLGAEMCHYNTIGLWWEPRPPFFTKNSVLLLYGGGKLKVGFPFTCKVAFSKDFPMLESTVEPVLAISLATGRTIRNEFSFVWGW